VSRNAFFVVKFPEEGHHEQRPREIKLKPARDALHNLIEQLAKVDLATLDDLKVRREGATKTATAWLAVLKLAAQELEQWCPDGGNSFVIPLYARWLRQ